MRLMEGLILGVLQSEQRDEDFFVQLELSEKDGSKSTKLGITVHGAEVTDVEGKKGIIMVKNSDGASVIISFNKPVGGGNLF